MTTDNSGPKRLTIYLNDEVWAKLQRLNNYYGLIKWDDDVEEDQFSQYSESQWVWVNQERATLKRAIRSRLRRGIFALKYCPKGDSQWYDSPRNFRGNSPAPKFMSFQVGIGKGHLQD